MSTVQIEARNQWLANQKEGVEIVDTLQIARHNKTNQQVKTYWGLAMQMAVSEFDSRGYDTSYLLRIDKPTGIGITKDMLYEYLCNVCPIYDEEGQRITLSKTTIKEMTKFFNDCRNYMASQWSIIIPDPNPDWWKVKEQNE